MGLLWKRRRPWSCSSLSTSDRKTRVRRDLSLRTWLCAYWPLGAIEGDFDSTATQPAGHATSRHTRIELHTYKAGPGDATSPDHPNSTTWVSSSMMSNIPTLAALGCIVPLALLCVRYLCSKRSSNLRGPSSTSLILGNELELVNDREAASLDFRWMREYGSTWRIFGYYGAEEVMTADPKAIQYILQKSGYNYPKRSDWNHLTWLLLGPGILAAKGESHYRHRKAMNPAFSAQQLRSFLPLFQNKTAKLMEKWTAELSRNPGGNVYVNRWLGRSSFDIIGEAAFDYRFGTLDNEQGSDLAQEYSRTLNSAQLYPSATTLFYRSLWKYIPDSLLWLTKYTPSLHYVRLRRLKAKFESIGKPLFHSNMADGREERAGKKDVMSILMRANAAENPNQRLYEDEVLAQMHTLTSAGHETTSSTMSWMLYELAKHPAYQKRIREEIRSVRAQVAERGGGNFTLEDLDSMKVTLAAIKETLRFHPIVYHIDRMAGKDDVIPLLDPVRGKDGSLITEVPVRKGQAIIISVAGYNRLPHVWGEDAHEWNPDRFSRLDAEKQVKVGVYANLLSFAAGVRACIGWRFALYQLQAVAADLLETFEFAIPEDKPVILRAPAGVMIPLVAGKEDIGAAMPLRVSLAA